MKIKITLISLALVGAAFFAVAQAEGPFHGKRGGFGRIVENLNLSEDQAAALDALREKHRATMQALRETGERPSREIMREQFAAHRSEIEAILNPDQLAALEEMKENRGERGLRGKRGKRGHHGHPLGRALHRLDLSDEQKEQLKALREQRRGEMQERRQSGERPTREEIEAHQAQIRSDLENILSSDQLAVLDEIKEKRGERGKRGHRGHHLGRALRQLDLSDDQQEQLKALRQEHRAEMKERRESGQKPTLEEIEAHRAAGRAKVEAILTPEQVEALKGLLPADAENNPTGAAKSSATTLESQSWGAIKEEAKKAE